MIISSPIYSYKFLISSMLKQGTEVFSEILKTYTKDNIENIIFTDTPEEELDSLENIPRYEVSKLGSKIKIYAYCNGSKIIIDTSNVRTVYFNYDSSEFFRGFTSPLTIEFNDKVNFSKVTNFNYLFADSVIQNINMPVRFENCYTTEGIFQNFNGNYLSENRLLSDFINISNTLQITNAKNMFKGFNPGTKLDLDDSIKLNLTNCLDFSSMFEEYEGTTNPLTIFNSTLIEGNGEDIINFDSFMKGVSNYEGEIDLTFADNSRVNLISSFEGCEKIKSILLNGKFILDSTETILHLNPVTQGYFRRDGSLDSSNSRWKVSDFIFIYSATSLKFEGTKYAGEYGVCHCFYNKDKNFIEAVPARNLQNQTIPEGAYYVRLSIPTSQFESLYIDNDSFIITGLESIWCSYYAQTNTFKGCEILAKLSFPYAVFSDNYDIGGELGLDPEFIAGCKEIGKKDGPLTVSKSFGNNIAWRLLNNYTRIESGGVIYSWFDNLWNIYFISNKGAIKNDNTSLHTEDWVTIDSNDSSIIKINCNVRNELIDETYINNKLCFGDSDIVFGENTNLIFPTLTRVLRLFDSWNFMTNNLLFGTQNLIAKPIGSSNEETWFLNMNPLNFEQKKDV